RSQPRSDTIWLQRSHRERSFTPFAPCADSGRAVGHLAVLRAQTRDPALHALGELTLRRQSRLGDDLAQLSLEAEPGPFGLAAMKLEHPVFQLAHFHVSHGCVSSIYPSSAR